MGLMESVQTDEIVVWLLHPLQPVHVTGHSGASSASIRFTSCACQLHRKQVCPSALLLVLQVSRLARTFLSVSTLSLLSLLGPTGGHQAGSRHVGRERGAHRTLTLALLGGSLWLSQCSSQDTGCGCCGFLCSPSLAVTRRSGE